MITVEEDGAWVTLQETIALHHEEVFACLTSAGGLMRWLAVNASIDLRQGGLIVIGWDNKMRHRSTIAILAYDPGGRIVWDWYTNRANVHAPVYWKVEPSVEEGSVVELRQGPFAIDVDSLLVMADEAQMWRWYLCNMRATLEGKLDMRRVRPL